MLSASTAGSAINHNSKRSRSVSSSKSPPKKIAHTTQNHVDSGGTSNAVIVAPPASSSARPTSKSTVNSGTSSTNSSTARNFAETVHYVIEADCSRWTASEIGAWLEVLYHALSQFFQCEPSSEIKRSEKLRICVFPSKEAYVARRLSLEPEYKDGGEGGLYYVELQTVFMYLNSAASDYFSRRLLLHEATHQFHYLAKTRNTDLKAKWYVEGLADYFGYHSYDETGFWLRGVFPRVNIDDPPTKAAAAFRSLGLGLNSSTQSQSSQSQSQSSSQSSKSSSRTPSLSSSASTASNTAMLSVKTPFSPLPAKSSGPSSGGSGGVTAVTSSTQSQSQSQAQSNTNLCGGLAPLFLSQTVTTPGLRALSWMLVMLMSSQFKEKWKQLCTLLDANRMRVALCCVVLSYVE